MKEIFINFGRAYLQGERTMQLNAWQHATHCRLSHSCRIALSAEWGKSELVLGGCICMYLPLSIHPHIYIDISAFVYSKSCHGNKLYAATCWQVCWSLSRWHLSDDNPSKERVFVMVFGISDFYSCTLVYMFEIGFIPNARTLSLFSAPPEPLVEPLVEAVTEAELCADWANIKEI